MDALLRFIDRLNEWIGKAVSLFFLVIMAITLYEVVARYGFNRPTMWVHETAGQLFGITFLLGGAYTLALDGHVRVDIFTRRLSQRGKHVAEIISSFFFFLFTGIMIVKGGEMAWESVMMLEKTQTPWEPYIFHVILMVPIGATLLFLQGVAIFIRNLKSLLSGRIS